jgi:malonate transporter MadL subunit
MAIYGTALLSLCLLAGLLAGKALGRLLGMDANVGGVGIAMLLLIWITDRLKREGALSPASESGLLFWSAIYIPVTVAMAATQNVRAAVGGGAAAILAGTLSVIACLALVPVLARIGRDDPPRPE